jgi:hypothetical protein
MLEKGMEQADHAIKSSIFTSSAKSMGSSRDSAYYSDFVIPIHDINKLLSNLRPEIIPAIFSLEFFRKILLQELSRKYFLKRLILRDDDLQDLIYLNPSLPHSVDVFISKSKINQNKLNQNNKLDNGSSSHDGVISYDGSITKALNKEWMNDMLHVLLTQCGLVEHMLWGYSAEESENGLADYSSSTLTIAREIELFNRPVLPLPDDIKSDLWFHVKKIKTLSVFKQQQISRCVVTGLISEFSDLCKKIVTIRKRILDVRLRILMTVFFPIFYFKS